MPCSHRRRAVGVSTGALTLRRLAVRPCRSVDGAANALVTGGVQIVLPAAELCVELPNR